MTVASVLRTGADETHTILPWVSVGSTLPILNQPRQTSALVVVSETGRVIGTLSKDDIIAGLETYGPDLVARSVEDVMSRCTPTCSPQDSLFSVMSAMAASDYRHVLIVRDAELLGVVSFDKVVSARLTEMELESGFLRDRALNHK